MATKKTAKKTAKKKSKKKSNKKTTTDGKPVYRCTVHPRYMANARPRLNCTECWAVWFYCGDCHWDKQTDTLALSELLKDYGKTLKNKRNK